MTQNLLDASHDDQIDPTKNYLEELVGDGKKFKTPEELARGKAEADLFIKMKNREFDQLKEDYLKLREESQTRAKLEELLDQFAQRNNDLNSHDNTDVNKDMNGLPSFDPKQVESLVSSKIQEYEMTKRQEENFGKVRAKLQEQFGNNYQNVLKQKIEALGLSEDFANTLAKEHPSVFIKTFELDAKPSGENFQTPPRGQQRSDSFSPTAGNKRTWSYYQELKAKNPSEYLSARIQTQMLKDMQELGDAFKDGDYRRFGN